MSNQNNLYGVMAEFEDTDTILGALKVLKQKGYKKMDAFTPFPVHGLDEALGFKDLRIKWMIFCGGILGALTGYGMQYYICVIDYPLNSGGKPLHSWPMFIPITFECTILFAAITGVIGMFALNGLPKLYHPVFDCSLMKGASQDKFLVCVEASDPKFQEQEIADLFKTLQATRVESVHSEEIKGF